MKAEIARFYGWSHFQIQEMTMVDLFSYYRSIESVRAREVLTQLKISDYPHQKGQLRSDYFNKVEKAAFPNKKRKDFNQLIDQMGATIG